MTEEEYIDEGDADEQGELALLPAGETATIRTPNGKDFKVGVVSDSYRMGKTARAKQMVCVYDYQIIPYIAELLKELPREKFDCLILITGRRRTGKSTLASQIARAVDDSFGLDHIAFRLSEFNDIVHKNPFADPKHNVFPQVILDEAGFDLFSQNWMQEMQKNLVKKFEVIGQKCQIVYLVLPHRMMLNRGLREGMVHLWINVSTFDGERGFAELRIGQENIWALEQYWKPLCAFTFGDIDDDFWKAYNQKKTTFINEVTAEIPEQGKTRVKMVVEQRNALIKYAYERKVRTMQELADITGITQTQICEIINETQSHVRKSENVGIRPVGK
jgi:hypothetical protein